MISNHGQKVSKRKSKDMPTRVRAMDLCCLLTFRTVGFNGGSCGTETLRAFFCLIGLASKEGDECLRRVHCEKDVQKANKLVNLFWYSKRRIRLQLLAHANTMATAHFLYSFDLDLRLCSPSRLDTSSTKRKKFSCPTCTLQDGSDRMRNPSMF